jgi:NAD(P)-dependent dehydrogenase (short-subunit alcohol dehydrogenase family)
MIVTSSAGTATKCPIDDIVPGAMSLPCDVRDYAAMAGVLGKVREQLGEFDVVVSGAAGNFVALADKMSSNAFRTVWTST